MMYVRIGTAVLFVVRVAFGGIWGRGLSGLMFGSLHGVVVVVVVVVAAGMDLKIIEGEIRFGK